MFTRNRVFKQREVVSNLHVCCNGFGKMWASYIFQFFKRILNSTHKKYNIFLHNICRVVPKFNFQLSIMSKRLASHISTKDSLKITIRKRYVYIDIRWPWKWSQYFYMGIWNDERIKIIFLLHFRSLHDYIHRTEMKQFY